MRFTFARQVSIYILVAVVLSGALIFTPSNSEAVIYYGNSQNYVDTYYQNYSYYDPYNQSFYNNNPYNYNSYYYDYQNQNYYNPNLYDGYYNSQSYYYPSNYQNYGINYCGVGFVNKGGSCISHTEDCKRTFGGNIGYGVAGTRNNSVCYCESGYDWNFNRTSCVPTGFGNVNYAPNYQYQNQDRSFLESQIASLQVQLANLRSALANFLRY